MNGQSAGSGPGSGIGYEPAQGPAPRRLARLALLPIPLLAAAIIAGRAASLSESYTSETLTLILSFTFYTLVSLGTLFLIGRSFLASGMPGLLLLECGVVLWSLAGTVGDAVSRGDANINVTIFNVTILLAGLCHLAGATLSMRKHRPLRAKPLWLGVSCALALAALWLVTQAALANWLPVFFISGQGGTPVRYCVLISAIATFVLSAGLLLTHQRTERAPFASWYALALLLLATGLFGVMIQLSLGSVVNWLGRIAQWLGGVYLLIAASAALRESDLPLIPSVEKPLPERYRYGVAVAIVLAAAAVRFALSPTLGAQTSFLIFYPAVVLAALYGGRRAGFLATVLSALIVNYFWIGPPGRFAIGNPADRVNLLFFFLSCTMICFVVDSMYKARARLILHQDHLEDLVQNRTAELEREVVERKQVEEALRESEGRLALAAGVTRIGMFDWTLATGKVLWTQAHDAIFGYALPTTTATTTTNTTTEHDYRRWADRVHPEDLPLVEGESLRCIKERKPLELQYRIIWPDGSLHWVETRGVCLYDSDDKAHRMLGVIIDITDRKRADIELANATTIAVNRAMELEAVMQAVPAFVFITHDPDSRYMRGNRATHDLVGVPLLANVSISAPQGEQPTTFRVMRDGREIPVDQLPVQQAARGREIRDYEFDLVFTDGTTRSLIGNATPLKDPYGTPNGAIGAFIDITARKQAEEALQRAHHELELRVEERTEELRKAYESLKEETKEREQVESRLRQSQKMEAIGTLAGGIAHDFNNILAAILGFTEMAVDDTLDRPEVGRSLQNVLKSAMRARDLVKQILAFSRKSNYERTPLSLTPLIKETVQLLRASIPATIEIKLTHAASSDTILASAVEVQQILMNLATNASLAMQEKGGILEISLTDIEFAPDSPVVEPDALPGEYLQLAVKDTGAGMSPGVMKRVFEPFFTTREVGQGTGMGLAVVYGIVKDLQGTITVESEPGAGSTFRVLLPKIKSEAIEEMPRTVGSSEGRERILFVDDEQMLVLWAEQVLSKLGYTVMTMTDSAEALEAFSSDPTRFDLIITDHTMSGMTGVQLSKEILRIRSDIPIILCTGHSETASPEIAREAGIREYLMKPLTKQELAEAVQKVLDARKEE